MRGRGCALVFALAATSTFAEPQMETLSGLDVALSEILLDENPGELWVRFRFLAPDLQGSPVAGDPMATARDMQELCNRIAVPYLAGQQIAPDRIVVSFSDRAVPFGQSDPDATQFFELFSLENQACIWEEF